MAHVTRIVSLGIAFWICVVAPSTGHAVALASSGATCIPADKCCKICDEGYACGNSCISRTKTCHKGRGCSCNANELCAAP